MSMLSSNNTDAKLQTTLQSRKEVLTARLEQLRLPEFKPPATNTKQQQQQANKQHQQQVKKKTRKRKAKGGGKKKDDNNNNASAVASSSVEKNVAAKTATALFVVPMPDNNSMLSNNKDTHWDFLLKEMQWLSADFSSERQRHLNTSKRIAKSVDRYYQQEETRYLRQLQQAEMACRKLASRISKQHVVKQWWDKIDKLITYQQKSKYEQSRNNAMNRHLVKLVRQTELYNNTRLHLLQNHQNDYQQDHQSNSNEIELALSQSQIKQRKSKQKVQDYARFLHAEMTPSAGSSVLLYGESTEDNSGSSDDTYSLVGDSDSKNNSDNDDDESTLRQAEEEETEIRNLEQYRPDPYELSCLREEQDMDISLVLERLREGQREDDDDDDKGGAVDTTTDKKKKKVVHFDDDDDDTLPPVAAEEEGKKLASKEEEGGGGRRTLSSRTTAAAATRPLPDPSGSDADDDMDASDVEDYFDDNNNKNEDMDDDDAEFVGDPMVVDDETTIEAEEKLGRDDMSVQQELDLLETEGNMPIEQLRALYESREEEKGDDDGSDDVDDIVEEEKEEESANKVELEFPPDVDEEDDDEFQPDEAAATAVDDETTIEAEEKLGREMSYRDELDVLKRENEMSVEELRAMYAVQDKDDGDSKRRDEAELEKEEDVEEEYLEEGEEAATAVAAAAAEPVRMTSAGRDGLISALFGTTDDQENDEDFCPDSSLKDDETTIEAEERMGREMTAEEEIDLLKRESEVPVDDLRRLYTGMEGHGRDDEEESDDILSSEPTGQKKRKLVAEVQKKNKKPRDEHDDGAQQNPADEGAASALGRLEASAELARNTTATRPFLIPSWVKLREYQQIGLNWLVSLQTRRLNGILADEMGLGKTLQTIALLAYLAAYKGIWGPHLIVVPTSVILNWEMELKRFCPGLKVLCYYGTAKHRKELRTGWTKTNWYHVVVTSYQLAVQDAFAFKRKRWYYLVLDEAQHIKNFQSQRWQTLITFNTQRRLLLTGTPLQNNLMELWSLLHFLMPYIFRSRKEFSYWFANPMSSMIEGSGDQNDSVVNRLHGILRPFVLRRLKKDVETQLPGKFEHIVKCQLSHRQMFMYEEFMGRSSTRQALKKGGSFMNMMNVLMQLRKVCNHPDLFEPRSVVTPFVLSPIVVPMPSCVIGMDKSISPFVQVSEFLVSPLWSGSQGLPSLNAGLRHDSIQSDELLAFESPIDAALQEISTEDTDDESVCPALKALAEEILQKGQQEKCDNACFLNRINSWRCRSNPFVHPQRLVDTLTVRDSMLLDSKMDALGSPSQLLALRRTQRQRADDMNELVKKFVFAVPKAGARSPAMAVSPTKLNFPDQSTLNDAFLEPLQECLRPFREAHARLSSFFPDKKLVQFDAGKLQTLAELLRERKRGGHKVLIFTQMSKMLDVLETFLNLNGHTYLRLDGATSVDRRQRLMDRFNNDPKIFCFILSTRSGGVGVNLTGADTVVFYDSDWNPAQDAQAQDRAHRIGQTREVHIYRLITEHTIEENILMKARQKRNLDILVMDRGNFDASQLPGGRETRSRGSGPEATADFYTKGGLREILGVSMDHETGESEADEETEKDAALSSDQLEKTMTSLEDADDVDALRGARKEAADELKEFDESIEYKKESDAEEDEEGGAKDAAKPEQANEEGELEKEIAAWQKKEGMDAGAIKAALSPAERYAMRYHQDIDPFYSIFAVLEHRRKMEEQLEEEEEIDVEEIERVKALEEHRAFEEGDLLATNPRPEDLIRQRNLYRREKARLYANKRRRKMTGENWELRSDAVSDQPFWYNIDTGEAIWDKPKVLLEMEAYAIAYEEKWPSMPSKPLVHIMSFLPPYPGRMQSGAVCKRWNKAASDISFVRHVYPVEMGAYAREEHRMEHNHFRTIEDAVRTALPGDTIELGDGHYWHNADLVVDFPICFVGDEHNPSNVVIELSGTIVWRAAGGFFEGITFRRPKISSSESSSAELLRIEGKGRIDMLETVFDNDTAIGFNVITARGPSSKGSWTSIACQNGACGVSLRDGAAAELVECVIEKNAGSGVSCDQESQVRLVGCAVKRNGGHGIELKGQSRANIRQCTFLMNKGLVLSKDSGCSTTCRSNVCTQSSPSAVAPPGFQFSKKQEPLD